MLSSCSETKHNSCFEPKHLTTRVKVAKQLVTLSSMPKDLFFLLWFFFYFFIIIFFLTVTDRYSWWCNKSNPKVQPLVVDLCPCCYVEIWILVGWLCTSSRCRDDLVRPNSGNVIKTKLRRNSHGRSEALSETSTWRSKGVLSVESEARGAHYPLT